jgi:multidrug resistance efflux pump
MNRIDSESHAALRGLLADLVTEPVKQSIKSTVMPEMDKMQGPLGIVKSSQELMRGDLDQLKMDIDEFREDAKNAQSLIQNGLVNSAEIQNSTHRDLCLIRKDFDQFRESVGKDLDSLVAASATDKLKQEIQQLALHLQELDGRVNNVRVILDANASWAHEEAATGNSASALAELRSMKRWLPVLIIVNVLVLAVCVGLLVR